MFRSSKNTKFKSESSLLCQRYRRELTLNSSLGNSLGGASTIDVEFDSTDTFGSKVKDSNEAWKNLNLLLASPQTTTFKPLAETIESIEAACNEISTSAKEIRESTLPVLTEIEKLLKETLPRIENEMFQRFDIVLRPLLYVCYSLVAVFCSVVVFILINSLHS